MLGTLKSLRSGVKKKNKLKKKQKTEKNPHKSSTRLTAFPGLPPKNMR